METNLYKSTNKQDPLILPSSTLFRCYNFGMHTLKFFDRKMDHNQAIFNKGKRSLEETQTIPPSFNPGLSGETYFLIQEVCKTHLLNKEKKFRRATTTYCSNYCSSHHSNQIGAIL